VRRWHCVGRGTGQGSGFVQTSLSRQDKEGASTVANKAA
jgi:hypothetical protein